MILHYPPLHTHSLSTKTANHSLTGSATLQFPHSSTALSDSPMEAYCALGFRRTGATGPNESDADDEGSFFDLVLKSPDRVGVARRRDVSAEKDFQFGRSHREVFVTRNDFSNPKPLYKVTLVRSTPKFRVFMLGFGKSSKCEKLECGEEPNWSLKSSKIEESNRLSVTCRVAKTPAACRVAGDNSLRSQILKETFDCESSPEKSVRGSLPKYLKLIKPLYLMVWKRQHGKAKFTGSATPLASPATAPANFSPKRISDASRIGNFKNAARRLGKSRSVSTAVGMAPQTEPRRDDSLLERHDGIQNAVLYCKKSYNSSSKETSKLFESSIDPLHLGRSSGEDPKRCSI